MAGFGKAIGDLNKRRGHLCVGIDPRPGRFPAEYGDAEGFQRWCLDLVEAAAPHAAAFKANLAFFLRMGPPGLEALEATVEAAQATGALTILDAKFGDIGSTSVAYASFAAEVAGVDAVTLTPYMGTDVVEPFQAAGLQAFVLARTTNPSAAVLQRRVSGRVIELFGPLDVGFVAPGNDPQLLSGVRQQADQAPLLIPGVGAQGGDPAEVAKIAGKGPFLVNSSRGIAEADGGFPESAAEAAETLASQLS